MYIIKSLKYDMYFQMVSAISYCWFSKRLATKFSSFEDAKKAQCGYHLYDSAIVEVEK